MPPRIIHPVGKRRSDLGIAPYARNAKLNNCCRKTAAPAAALGVLGRFVIDIDSIVIYIFIYSTGLK